MKDIGQTTRGGFLVEMTPDEHQAFELLQGVARNLDSLSSRHGVIGRDLTDDQAHTLYAIRNYVDARFLVNDLRTYVDAMQTLLGGKA